MSEEENKEEIKQNEISDKDEEILKNLSINFLLIKIY